MYTYNCKLLRVIDGDTVRAQIDLGFDVWVTKTIRLTGINAPESRTRDKIEKVKGLEAKARLIELLEHMSFKIQSHGVGKFGRCLGVLYVDDININEQLITEGHAVEYDGGKR